jgi:hypothetical protein
MDTRRNKLAKVLNAMEMRKKSNMPADEMMQTLDELPQGTISPQDMQLLIMQQNAMPLGMISDAEMQQNTMPLPPNPPIVRDESMPPDMLNANEVQRMIIDKGQSAMQPNVINATQAQALMKQRKKQAAMPPLYKNMQ